jgi:PAS domain S-box-containing protein
VDDDIVDPIAVQDAEADRLRGELAIDAAGIGTFDWDLGTGDLEWDERLIEMFGYDPDTFDRSISGFNARLHPDDVGRVAAELQASIDECGDFSSLYRVCLPTGDTRWFSARGRVLCDPDGRASRLLGAAYDITDQRSSEQGVIRVLEAMPAAFYSLDRQWRFAYVNAEAERLLGRNRTELLGEVIWRAFPAANDSEFEDNYRRAVTTGEPVAFDAYYPEPLNGWYELRAWPSPDGLSVYFLEVTERRRAQEEAQRTAARIALMAQVSRELGGSLNPEVITARVPHMAVPVLADGCIVSLLDPYGRPDGVGSWHADPARRGVLAEYTRARLDALPVLSAVRTGERVVLGRAEALEQAPTAQACELLAQLDLGRLVALPLSARGRTLGLLTLLFDEGRTPDADDLGAVRDLADRTALALDNALLYGQQRQLAEELQRSMLTAPPEPDHAEIVVRYLPATEAAAVGGDWYDAFLQRNGATTLVIGDVAGHDTAAAATMGQLRSLLRGIATSSEAGPAEVLASLDSAMSLLRVDNLATAAVARFEQTDEERECGVTRMRWSNAGHLPPLVIEDGAVTPLDGPRPELLLGVDPDTARTESVVTLGRGATVLLYTDGLVERRDADLDAGIAQLRAALTDLADRPLEELCDAVLDRLVAGHPDDDVALVAIRLHRQDGPRPAEAGWQRLPDDVPPE